MATFHHKSFLCNASEDDTAFHFFALKLYKEIRYLFPLTNVVISNQSVSTEGDKKYYTFDISFDETDIEDGLWL